jgi:hypothetical protein
MCECRERMDALERRLHRMCECRGRMDALERRLHRMCECRERMDALERLPNVVSRKQFAYLRGAVGRNLFRQSNRSG